jgi:ABC-type nitrate/sulfonate/bicarbonate transport system permease component
VVAHPICEAVVPQGGGPIFIIFCIHIYDNVNRFLRPIFQFMAPLPSICLFMIFLFTFYANDLLIYALSRLLNPACIGFLPFKPYV